MIIHPLTRQVTIAFATYDDLKAQAALVPELVETLDSARGLLARSWAHLPRKIQLYKDVECVLETMRLALAKADSSRTEVDRPPRPSPVSPLCSERRTGRGGREAIMPKGVKL